MDTSSRTVTSPKAASAHALASADTLGSEENLLGDDKEWQALKGPGEWMASKEVENAEAAILRARQEAFEYGCDIAPA